MSLEDKSYSTVIEADSYWADRDNSDWASATTSQKEAALIKATEFIDMQFEWIGTIKTDSQVLMWPRSGARDKQGRLRDGIPSELKNAVSWLALHILNTEPDPPTSRNDILRSLEAGPVSIEFAENSPRKSRYDHLYRILKNIIIGSSNSVKLVRT